MATFPENSHNYTSLFDAPLKDYTIIAKDGREIYVHKLILWSECNMFKALFNRTEMKQEDFIQTTHDYDALLLVIKWIYGFYIDITEDMYDIADHFQIPYLLNWRLYITINENYIYRFVKVENDEIDILLIEEQNYEEIYNEVVSAIAKICYYTMGLDRNNEWIYTKENKSSLKLANNLIYNVSVRMLKSWITSRNRLNSEDEVMTIIKEYIHINPHSEKEVRCDVIPLVNADFLGILQYDTPSRGYGDHVVPSRSVTYFEFLTQFTTDIDRKYLLLAIVLPNNYDDRVISINIDDYYVDGGDKYVKFSDRIKHFPKTVNISDRFDADDDDIYIKDVDLYYRVSDGNVRTVKFSDIIKTESEYKELLATKLLFKWNLQVEIEHNLSAIRKLYGIEYKERRDGEQRRRR